MSTLPTLDWVTNWSQLPANLDIKFIKGDNLFTFETGNWTSSSDWRQVGSMSLIKVVGHSSYTLGWST